MFYNCYVIIKTDVCVYNSYMNRKKVVIIGGGVSGLSCGIYCQKYGFDSIILEKTSQTGGNLTGWYRNDCYIDNCLHWLNGSSEKSNINKLWKEIGAIDSNTKFYQPKYFYVSLNGNKAVKLGENLEESKKKMLETCPLDEKQIKKFFKTVKNYIKLKSTTNKFKKMIYAIRIILTYKRKTLFEVSKKCKTKLMQNFFTDYILGEYSAYVLVVAYASFVMGDGKTLKTGSLDMASKILQTYIKMGGIARVKNMVKGVVVKNDKIVSVVTSDGVKYEGDYFVFACDPTITYNKILKSDMPLSMLKTYRDRKNFPIISSFHIAYDVSCEKIDLPETVVFDCKDVKIGETVYNRLMLRNYDYGINFAPQGHSVLQVFLLQREQDFEYFSKLSKQDYKKEKQKICNQITKEIENNFPFLEGKIKMIDCWTPLTYTRYFDAYKGAYMSFGITKKVKFKKEQFKICRYDNAFIASQWQTLFGGLPNALLQGKNCAMQIFKNDNC